jgi:PAS domain S-box-containing protein
MMPAGGQERSIAFRTVALESPLARRLRFGALIALAAAVAICTLYIFGQIDIQLRRSHTADSDSTPWVLSQIEVEMLQLRQAMTEAATNPDDPALLQQVRLPYDLLFSRTTLAQEHSQTGHLAYRTSPVWAELVGDGGYLQAAMPLIDGPDETLGAALGRLGADLGDLAARMRPVLVTSVLEALREAKETREDLRTTLQTFSAVSIGLFGTLAGLVLTIHMQSRAREKSRRELARTVHNLRLTIDSSLDAAVILDRDGAVIGANSAGAELFRRACSGGTGCTLAMIVPGIASGSRGIDLLAEDCAARGGRITLSGRREDGSAFPLELSLVKARNADGRPIAIAFLRDIAERVARDQELRDARNAALQGEEAKARFLAVMSHEMRTPLNGMIAAMDLIEETRLDLRQARLVRIATSCARTALEQVNNVLELARLRSAGDAPIPETVFDPIGELRRLAGQVETDATRRGNSVTLVAETPLPAHVLAPRTLFSRIFANLLSNAVKFTENGRIELRASAAPAQDGRIELTVRVSDSGIGIDPQDISRIFRDFETLDSSYARKQEGSGLGLGIAKLSAETMGGGIAVESRPGEGSTFTVTLKLQPAEEAAPEPASLPAGREPALTLLVVEENPINRELLAEALRLRGHRVILAENGAVGVEAARRDRPDAILMDVSMPVMDGLEATRRIRAENFAPGLPIIGVTASAGAEKQREFMAAGMTDVLVKPVSVARPGEVLRGLASGGTRTVEPAPSGEDLVDPAIFDELAEAFGQQGMDRMLARFRDETGVTLDALTEAAAKGDFEAATKYAHEHAGAAAALGLRGLHAL